MLSTRSLALKGTLLFVAACSGTTPTTPGEPGPGPNPPPPVPVASITLSATEVTIERGNTIRLTATPRGATGQPLADRPVTWHSAAPQVATITNGDRITAVGSGTAVITATAEGKSATVTVRVPEVTPAVVALVAPQTEVVVPVGTARFLDVVPVDADGVVVPNVPLAWASQHDLVASITPGGAVMTHRAGATTITARAGGLEAVITVYVVPVPSATPVVDYPLASVDGGIPGGTYWTALQEQTEHYSVWRLKRLMGATLRWDVRTQGYRLALQVRSATATTWHNGSATIEGEIVDETIEETGTISYGPDGVGLRFDPTAGTSRIFAVQQDPSGALVLGVMPPAGIEMVSLRFARP